MRLGNVSIYNNNLDGHVSLSNRNFTIETGIFPITFGGNGGFYIDNVSIQKN